MRRAYTYPQRRVIETLRHEGAMQAGDLAREARTSPAGLSIITNHCIPLVAWADEPEVFYIPREHHEAVDELIMRWQR